MADSASSNYLSARLADEFGNNCLKEKFNPAKLEQGKEYKFNLNCEGKGYLTGVQEVQFRRRFFWATDQLCISDTRVRIESWRTEYGASSKFSKIWLDTLDKWTKPINMGNNWHSWYN